MESHRLITCNDLHWTRSKRGELNLDLISPFFREYCGRDGIMMGWGQRKEC